ncbi:MAG: hypothetical protein HQ543_02465 [Bacteroidetes bacterium]|nr:hypothetical protein [Bacteroidota bacterium]
MIEKSKYNFIDYEVDEEYENDLLVNKEEFNKRFEERYNVLESNIWTIKHIKKTAIKKEHKENIILWNVAGFLNIVAYDLISAGYNLIFEEKRWQKIYFARQVALIICEAMKDIPEVLSKNYKELFIGKDLAEEYINELNKYKKELTNFKKIYLKKLYEIRINVSAHHDQDIDNQLNIICEMNPYELIKTMTEFEIILRKISDHIQKLVIYTVKLEK